eukprot:3466923-Rhodomonas_salina.2
MPSLLDERCKCSCVSVVSVRSSAVGHLDTTSVWVNCARTSAASSSRNSMSSCSSRNSMSSCPDAHSKRNM